MNDRDDEDWAEEDDLGLEDPVESGSATPRGKRRRWAGRRLLLGVGAGLALVAGALALGSGPGRPLPLPPAAGSAEGWQLAAAPDVAPAELELLPEEELVVAPPRARRELTPEERRFQRADRNRDGRISQAEFLANRRRAFDRLDRNGDGVLSFAEYAAAGIERFARADISGTGYLTPAEFATTAQRRTTPARTAGNCVCPPTASADAGAEDGEGAS